MMQTELFIPRAWQDGHTEYRHHPENRGLPSVQAAISTESSAK